MKFDMHCHTKEGSLDGKVPVEEFIALLKKKGFGGMLISDHNSYDGYRFWKKNGGNGEHRDFVVLRGIEYDTIDAGHILVIMPENVHLRILELRGLPVKLLIDIVHRSGGVLGPAHPCGEKYLSITNTRKYRNCLSVMDQFDFLEGFNACESAESNERARKLAVSFDKPVFGGSDAHKADCVGLGGTVFSEDISSESQLIALIREKGRNACRCGGEYYGGTTKERIGRANDILVQSFWFYNHLGSMYHFYRRHAEVKRLCAGVK